MKSIGERIKVVRVLSWFTQDEFAKRVGVSRRQIVYWESGTDNPSADRLMHICDVLKVSIDWLLTGKGTFQGRFNAEFSARNRQRYLAAMGTLKAIKLPLYEELPSGPVPLEVPSRHRFLAAQEADALSFVYEINDRALEPIYSPGDMLFLHILNQVFSAGSEADAASMLQLHNRHVALMLNGTCQLSRVEATRRNTNRLSVTLNSLVGETRHVFQQQDTLLLQGVVYKFVRQV